MKAKSDKIVKKKITQKVDKTIDINEKKKEMFLNSDVYPLDVIYRACFTFLNRLYIFLDIEKDGKIRVELSPKYPMSQEEWLSIVGEFKNELLTSALRNNIAKTASRVRDIIVEKAIIGALPVQTGEIRLGEKKEKTEPMIQEEDNLDFLDDPLGIAVPWEEKYGKKA